MVGLEPCAALAAQLVAAADPAAALPDPLPVPALDLLICLHLEVTRTMLSDLGHAGRAAAAAVAIARRFPDDALLQAQAEWSQGSAILFLPNYARSLRHYDAALRCYERARQQHAPQEPPRDVRAIQIVRVFCLSELGRYREAQEAVAAAERWLQEHPNDHMRLALLGNRNQLAGAMGNYQLMLDLANAAADLASQLDQPARIAYAWINYAHAAVALGRFDDAQAALDQGIAAAHRADEPLTVARGHYNRARLLRCQGQLFAALQALRVAEAGLAQATNEAATIALEEAAIYEQLWQFPEALRAARRAAQLYAQQAMPTYCAEAALQAARLATHLRQPTAVRRLLDLARAQTKEARAPFLEAELTLADARLVTWAMEHSTPRKATKLRRAALAATVQAIALLEAHGLAYRAAHGQLTRALLETQLGDRAAAKTTYWTLIQHHDPNIRLSALLETAALCPPSDALPYLQHAAALVIEQRRMLPMEELLARYSSETSLCHLRLALCQLALGDTAAAFESVCAAKAGPFLDLRAAATTLDAATMAVLEARKADLARLRAQVHEHRGKAMLAAQQEQHERVAYHTQQAEAAAALLSAHEQSLSAELRTTGDRQAQARVPSHAAVQQALPPGTALLEYAIFDDELGCFLLTSRAAPIYRRLGSARALASFVDRWSLVCRRLMDEPEVVNGPEQLVGVLVPLWQLLVEPWSDLLSQPTDLLVAPDGLLHHIPWAALHTGRRFLGEQQRVTVTMCGAVYAAEVNAGAFVAGPARVLGYTGSESAPLAHVGAELACIARHLPDAQVDTAASAADLRALPPPRLLHIAAHASANAAAPLCSAIELSDGPFLLLEAHRLNLHGTGLVVLSACETGVRPDRGDMPLALVGAFFCAGATSVLATLWRVSDAAAALLMDSFYAALERDVPLSAALQEAQAHVRARFPLDWAAFQLWAAAPPAPLHTIR